jgi:hypothetical protein
MPLRQRKINLPQVRQRAKKELRKKYKKTVSLRQIQNVWKDFVELKVIPELIENGEVKLDDHTKIFIEGNKILKSKHLSTLKSGHVIINGKPSKNVSGLRKGREGIIYRIGMIDTLFKEGNVIFHADKKIKEAVHKALITTNKYYHVNQ